MGECVIRQVAVRRQVEFLHEPRAVGAHGLNRQRQGVGNVARGLPSGQFVEHLQLASRELLVGSTSLFAVQLARQQVRHLARKIAAADRNRPNRLDDQQWIAVFAQEATRPLNQQGNGMVVGGTPGERPNPGVRQHETQARDDIAGPVFARGRIDDDHVRPVGGTLHRRLALHRHVDDHAQVDVFVEQMTQACTNDRMAVDDADIDHLLLSSLRPAGHGSLQVQI